MLITLYLTTLRLLSDLPEHYTHAARCFSVIAQVLDNDHRIYERLNTKQDLIVFLTNCRQQLTNGIFALEPMDTRREEMNPQAGHSTQHPMTLEARLYRSTIPAFWNGQHAWIYIGNLLYIT